MQKYAETTRSREKKDLIPSTKKIISRKREKKESTDFIIVIMRTRSYLSAHLVLFFLLKG